MLKNTQKKSENRKKWSRITMEFTRKCAMHPKYTKKGVANLVIMSYNTNCKVAKATGIIWSAQISEQQSLQRDENT